MTGADLHSCVRAFDLLGVKELLNTRQISVDVPDGLGASPLMTACQRGEASIVDELLVRGANINFTNSAGKSVLMLACFSGHTAIVELLLREKADIHLRDKGQAAVLFLGLLYFPGRDGRLTCEAAGHVVRT